MNLRDALAQLKDVRAHGSYFTARCPAHDDRNASLSIREGERAFLKCFAGCDYRTIIAALDGRSCRKTRGLDDKLPMLASPPDNAERIEIARRNWRNTKPGVTAGGLALYDRDEIIRTLQSFHRSGYFEIRALGHAKGIIAGIYSANSAEETSHQGPWIDKIIIHRQRNVRAPGRRPVRVQRRQRTTSSARAASGGSSRSDPPPGPSSGSRVKGEVRS
jgi:hypothetical protein